MSGSEIKREGNSEIEIEVESDCGSRFGSEGEGLRESMWEIGRWVRGSEKG